MSTKSFAKELKDIAVSLKTEQGINEIKIDNLINYLDEVLSEPEEVTPEKLEKYKAELQVWVEENKVAKTAQLEVFKAVILQGQSALKSAFIMNGGASIAILAFLGKLSDSKASCISCFTEPMQIFVTGVFLAGLSSGVTYLSQWASSYDTDAGYKIGFGLNLLVIIMGLSSYGCFIWGALSAVEVFHKIA